MTAYKEYRKKQNQLLRPYVPGEDMSHISVSATDTPELGGMIGINPNNTDDQWYVAKKFFEDNYELAKDNYIKTLHNSDISGARQNVKDIKVVGNGDMFQLLCKASSENEGWMKSTKAMELLTGCVVQVTTQQRNPDGSYSIAEAITFVPHTCIVEDENNGRKLDACEK